MTNHTARVIIDGDTSKMRCPHFEECHRVVIWRNVLGKESRKLELVAYRWFNRQDTHHEH